MPACRVTVKRKRYTCPRVFVCVGCDLLTHSERAHTITCSGSCRVRVHREPARLRKLEALAVASEINVQMILDSMAQQRLRPDLSDRIVSGESGIDDIRQDVWQAYVDLWEKQG